MASSRTPNTPQRITTATVASANEAAIVSLERKNKSLFEALKRAHENHAQLTSELANEKRLRILGDTHRSTLLTELQNYQRDYFELRNQLTTTQQRLAHAQQLIITRNQELDDIAHQLELSETELVEFRRFIAGLRYPVRAQTMDNQPSHQAMPVSHPFIPQQNPSAHPQSFFHSSQNSPPNSAFLPPIHLPPQRGYEQRAHTDQEVHPAASLPRSTSAGSLGDLWLQNTEAPAHAYPGSPSTRTTPINIDITPPTESRALGSP